MNTRSIVWTLGGLTVLALVLRIIGLNNGLWYDEITTLVEYVRKPLPEIMTHYSKNNHMLYSVMAHASLSLFGEHPWSLRVPAVLFAIACIPALYMLGTMITSQLEALLAAGLLSVSYHHIWFSQDARGYTALVLWTLLSTFFLLHGLRDKKVGWYIAYGLAAALGLYSHLSMGFVILAHLLISVSQLRGPRDDGWRTRATLPALGFTLTALFSALLYAPVLMQVPQAFGRTFPDPQTKVATFHWAFWETIHSFQTGLGIWGMVFSCLLSGLGVWSYFKQSRPVFSLLMLPGFLVAFGILILGSPIRPRFFFLLIGFGFLTVVRGAMLAAGWASQRWTAGTGRQLNPPVIGTVLVGVIVLANVTSLGILYQYPKQDYEGALRFVEATRTADEPVITAGLAVRPYHDYYGREWKGVESGDELQAVRSSLGRIWMLYSFPEYMEPALATSIRQECPPVRVFYGTLGGGNVVVCLFQPKSLFGTNG